MKKHAKKAIAYAEAHGYEFERQNAKGALYYRSRSGHEVGIFPGADDAGLRHVMLVIDRVVT